MIVKDDTVEFELQDIVDVLFAAVEVVREQGIGAGSLYNQETGNVCFLGGIAHAADKVAYDRGLTFEEPSLAKFVGHGDLRQADALDDEDIGGHLAVFCRAASEPLVPASIPSWNDGLREHATENVIARLQAAARNIQEKAAADAAGEGDRWSLDPETFCLTNLETGAELPIPEIELQDRPLVEAMIDA